MDNIDRIEELDAAKKAEMIAEVRFLRAFAYYNMSQYWGGVPLVTTILSMEEANSVISETKEIKKGRAREYPPLIKSYVKDNLERR